MVRAGKDGQFSVGLEQHSVDTSATSPGLLRLIPTISRDAVIDRLLNRIRMRK